jgi:pimeloyl-ACP methyl ester carboxylesterase
MRFSRATGIATTAMRFPSRLRALILIAIVLDLRRLGRLVRALTAEPRVDTFDVDRVEVEVVRPGGEGPWPAWVFINGAHPQRRREPVVTQLSRGLARAGFIVFVPDLPGLGEGTITNDTLDAACRVTSAAAGHADVRNGRVALIGASTGAGLALLAAANEGLADRVSVVAAVAPFADLERMICLATTRSYAEDGRFTPYAVTPLHRRVVARSLAATISDSDEREVLLTALAASEGDEESDPIEQLPRDLRSPEGRAVLDVLTNADPERFAAAYGGLAAEVRERLAHLSPLGACPRVTAPVELVVPPSDEYFPLGEARALAAALPNAHLTVTATLEHTRPEASLVRLRSLLRFDRFVVRGLRAAAAG